MVGGERETERILGFFFFFLSSFYFLLLGEFVNVGVKFCVFMN